MLAAGIESEIQNRYSVVRSALPNACQLAVLHIGPEQTAMAFGDHHEAAQIALLAIGWQSIASDYFKHAPATALELENAIVTVEDEIARARSMLHGNWQLHTTDAALREIAVLSGVTESSPMVLSIEAMEQTFDRMAQVALGRPAAQSGLPASNEFAARLLILRELMHHLQFSTLTCHLGA